MTPWVPCPVDSWPEVAEILTASGVPWPRGAVVTDLRWHVDQRQPLGGRPALCQRWGWNDRAVRAILAAEAEWRDPKHPEPLLRTGMVEARAGKRRTVPASPGQSAPVPASPETDEAAQNTLVGQSAPVPASPGQSLSNARVSEPPSPSPAPARENARARPAAEEDAWTTNSSPSASSAGGPTSGRPSTGGSGPATTAAGSSASHGPSMAVPQTDRPTATTSPAAEEAACTHDPETEPSAEPAHPSRGSLTVPAPAAATASTLGGSRTSASAAPAASAPGSPTTTATTTAATSGAAEPHAHVVGRREPRDGGTAPASADEAIVLGLALQRLQAHTPGARRIQGGSARALLAAHREGLTPDDLGAVCRWLDGAPGWAATLRERGQAVDSWAVVLGRDWRGLVAQARRWEADGCPEVEAARPPPTARGSPTARAGAGFGGALAKLIEREEGQADIIDVEVWHGDEGGHREGVRGLATGGPGQARRLVDRARAGG